MSYAFVSALKKNPQQSYVQLLNSIRVELEGKYSQKPQLSSSHPLSESCFPPAGCALTRCPQTSTCCMSCSGPRAARRACCCAWRWAGCCARWLQGLGSLFFCPCLSLSLSLSLSLRRGCLLAWLCQGVGRARTRRHGSKSPFLDGSMARWRDGARQRRRTAAAHELALYIASPAASGPRAASCAPLQWPPLPLPSALSALSTTYVLGSLTHARTHFRPISCCVLSLALLSPAAVAP